MEDNKKIHALLIPLPLQGHVIPFVRLAMKLASHGVTVTFVNTNSIDHLIVESNSQRTAGDIFAGARDSGLDIRYTTIHDGSPLDFDRTNHHDQFFQRFLEVVNDRVDEVINIVGDDDDGQRVNCLIADTFYAWPSVIAEKHGLVNVSFWTEPLIAFTIYYHWDLIRSHGHSGPQGNEEVEIDYIPGIGSIKPKDLTSYIQLDDTTSVVARAIRDDFKHVNNVDLIITNTVAELEPEPLAALNKKWPIYTIGPLLPTGLSNGSVATSMWSESDCTHWLNTKPKGSVLYVSFGSWAPIREHTIMEIAHGLMLSGVCFIWVLRQNTDKTHLLLPVGFDEKVKAGQGLVVPWCCQVNVISHEAIGGFLTHCGWNSVLESIWCSVPMLCYPLVADQPTNRKLVVDDWGIGINLCDGDELCVTREEVATKINGLMVGKSGEELKERVMGIRGKVGNAVESNGSSEKNLVKFINDVKVRVLSRNVCAS